MKRYLVLVTKILTTVFTVLTAILLTANAILMENSAAVSNFLGATTQAIIEDSEKAETEDTQYYKSEFNSVAEVQENGKKLGQQVVAEGSVLLKNDNAALPIAKGSRVNLYSASSVNLAVGGGGSSATNAKSLNLKECLTAPSVNLQINETLWNFYQTDKDKGTNAQYARKTSTSIGAAPTISDAPWDALPAAKNDEAKAGIFVLSRLGSENIDIRVNAVGYQGEKGDPSDLVNGNYLELNENEKTVLKGMKALKDAGKIESVIVVLNMANQVELDFLDDAEYGIDAAFWCGSLGSTGAKAIADILVGNVNPSGRLADTFWLQHQYNPILSNFGEYYYAGNAADGKKSWEVKMLGADHGTPYVVYQEGIYNGYRYAETRYEDVVTGRANAGDFNYGGQIAYPFGYGLSYTTFAYSDFSVTYNAEKDVYETSVKVTNTGEVAGKEVVQIYIQKPYTAYDVEHGVEKAAVELAGFAKTKTLAAGSSETVTVEVEGKYFASYDSYGAKTYIVEEGRYYLAAGKDAHDAENNILAARVSDGSATVDGSKVFSFENRSAQDGVGEASLVFSEDKTNFDAETYSTAVTGEEITNKFDQADMNLYSNKGTNAVEYMTRNNWAGTVHYGIDADNHFINGLDSDGHYDTNNVKFTWEGNEGLQNDLLETFLPQGTDDVAYPTYNSKATSYTLMDLRVDAEGNEIPYDDPMWEDLLDQMSWEDYVELLSCGERMTVAIASIGKPSTIDHNGAVGVNQKYGANEGSNRGYAVTTNDPNKNSVPPAYPCNGIVAATYNVELMQEYGNAWGEDALWAGYAGLYGPGINLHRGPYAGRTFEYYSEDSFLSGKICAPICQAIREKGIYVYLKHCFLNEQESCRGVISTWANEQTIRELYMRAFQIAIEEGGAQNVMLGLNKVGAVGTLVQGFCNSVLRDEFGMSGFVVTDFQSDGAAARMPLAHQQGCDLPDRNYYTRKPYAGYEPGTKHGKVAWGMRESAHRILYTVVHSASMNGLSSSAKIIKLTPDWQYWINFATNASMIVAIGCAVLLVTFYAFPFLQDKYKIARAKAEDEKKQSKKSSPNREQTVRADIEADVARAKAVVGKGTREDVYLERKEPKSLSFVRLGLIGVLSVALLISVIGVFGSVSYNKQILREAEASRGEAVLDETSGVEGLESYRFEAEAAEFTGTTSINGFASGADFNYQPDADYSYEVNEAYSGGVLVRGYLSSVKSEKRLDEKGDPVLDEKGDPIYDSTTVESKFTFRFNSDKKVKVGMRVCISVPKNWINVVQPLGSLFTIYVNGEKLPSSAVGMTPGFDKTVKAGEYYLAETNAIPILLQEGENVVEFVATTDGSYQRAFDYIEIDTSANLTGFNPSYWDLSDFSFLTKPTTSEGGELITRHGYRYEVPSLSVGVSKGFYTYVDDEEAVTYYLFDSDTVVYQMLKLPYTLTLDSPYAYFAPDEDNAIYLEKEVIVTGELPETVVRVPRGYKFIGWVDADNPSACWDKNAFMMPDRDTTIIPVFEKTSFVTTPGETLGKIQLIPDAPDSHTPIRNDKIKVGEFGKVKKDGTHKIAYTNGVLIDGDLAERATVYSYLGKVEAGWSFLTMHAMSVSGQSSLLYTIQNQGSESVSFILYQANSSGNPTAAGNPNEEFTLRPGEKTTFCLHFTFSNGNVMSYFYFTSALTDGFSLAVNEQIVKGNLTGYDIVKSTATLAGGATFASGETTAQLKQGAALPPVNLSAADAGKKVYGYLVSGNSTRTLVTDEDFRMPAYDVTIEPLAYYKAVTGWIVDDGTGEKYVSAAAFSFDPSYVSVKIVETVTGGNGTLDWNAESKPIQNHFTPQMSTPVTSAAAVSDGKYGTTLSLTGETGQIFRTMTPYQASGTYRFTYTFKNTGSAEIRFTCWQVNSGTVTDGRPSAVVTLSAGESVTVTLEGNCNNPNVMCLFRMDANVTGGKLFMSTFVEKVS